VTNDAETEIAKAAFLLRSAASTASHPPWLNPQNPIFAGSILGTRTKAACAAIASSAGFR
jgi:hypothetical protein